MKEWSNVRWTQARQIVGLMDPAEALTVAETVTPAAYFAQLIAKGEQEAAVLFLSLALPRLEGVAWATEAIRAAAPADGAQAEAREQVGAWLKDPSDARRRAAWEAGMQASDWSPERLLAHAAFLSGGSIAPPDLPAVQPDPHLSGRMAATAIITAAHASGDAEAILGMALNRGEMIARGDAG